MAVGSLANIAYDPIKPNLGGHPAREKSQTLRAIIVAALLDAHSRNIPLRILISANGYSAIDNVLLDLPDLLKTVMPNVPVHMVRLQGGTKETPAKPTRCHSAHNSCYYTGTL